MHLHYACVPLEEEGWYLVPTTTEAVPAHTRAVCFVPVRLFSIHIVEWKRAWLRKHTAANNTTGSSPQTTESLWHDIDAALLFFHCFPAIL